MSMSESFQASWSPVNYDNEHHGQRFDGVPLPGMTHLDSQRQTDRIHVPHEDFQYYTDEHPSHVDTMWLPVGAETQHQEDSVHITPVQAPVESTTDSRPYDADVQHQDLTSSHSRTGCINCLYTCSCVRLIQHRNVALFEGNGGGGDGASPYQFIPPAALFAMTLHIQVAPERLLVHSRQSYGYSAIANADSTSHGHEMDSFSLEPAFRTVFSDLEVTISGTTITSHTVLHQFYVSNSLQTSVSMEEEA